MKQSFENVPLSNRFIKMIINLEKNDEANSVMKQRTFCPLPENKIKNSWENVSVFYFLNLEAFFEVS